MPLAVCGRPLNPPPPPPGAGASGTMAYEGGGTHNHFVPSPDGQIFVAAADVGGVRYIKNGDIQWSYLPVVGGNAGRQVAALAVTDEGIVFVLAGNALNAGVLQRIDINTGTVTTLVENLDVLANSLPSGDTGARPRSVGWQLIYDRINDTLFYLVQNGMGRYNVGTSTDDGIIALSGIGCAGFVHAEDAVVTNAGFLVVLTRTDGVQHVSGIKGTATATRISPAGVDRAEDGAWLNKSDGSMIVACHENGVYRRDATDTWIDVTPLPVPNTGGDGNTTRWTTVATMKVGANYYAAIASVSPPGDGTWIYRSLDAAAVTGGPTGGTWEEATLNPAIMGNGSTHNSPPNRILGQSAGSGANIAGTWGAFFDPKDPTGNTLLTTGTLSLYRGTGFAGAQNSITWFSFNPGLSMVSFADIWIDAEGYGILPCADHNAAYFSPSSFPNNELNTISVSNINDGWGVHSVDSGARKLTVLCPADDKAADAFNPAFDVLYHIGTGAPSTFQSTGYNADLNGAGSLNAGERPRPGGVFVFLPSPGATTATAVVWGDSLGWVRSTYTFASDSWSTWQIMTSGPVSNLRSENQLQTRDITGAADGSLIVGVQLKTGQLWRSLDGGDTFDVIAGGTIGTPQAVRTGRVAYIEATDTLVASDGNGLYRISDPRGAATVTPITGITNACQIAVDSANRLYAHERIEGVAKLWRFPAFATATSTADASPAGSDKYLSRCGELATVLATGTVAGKEYLFTGYQGAGAYYQEIVD